MLANRAKGAYLKYTIKDSFISVRKLEFELALKENGLKQQEVEFTELKFNR